MLRVAREQDRFQIEGVHALPLLHHNLAGHLGMDRAEVGISAWLGKSVGKRIIRIERLGLETLVVANNVVWDIVLVDPADRAAHRHRQRIRRKNKIVDFDLRRGLIFHRRAKGPGPARHHEKHDGERGETQCQNCSFHLLILSCLCFPEITPKSNRPRPARVCPGRSSRRGCRARSSIARLELSWARVKALLRVLAAERPWKPRYGTSRCPPPSAWSGGCAR